MMRSSNLDRIIVRKESQSLTQNSGRIRRFFKLLMSYFYRLNPRWFRISLFIIAALLIGFSPFMGKFPLFNWHSDPYGTLVISQNILRNHTINLKNVKNYWEQDKGQYSYQISRIGRNYYSSYPLGTPILSLPFVAIGNIFGVDMTKHEKVMQQIICMCIAICLFIFLFLIARIYFSFYLSLFIGFLGYYGTTVGTVIGTGLWNLNFEIFFIVLAVYILFSSIQNEEDNIPLPVSVILGFSLFAAYISRPTASFFILSVLLFLLSGKRKRSFIIVSLTSGVPFLLYQGLLYFQMGGVVCSNMYSLHNFTSHSALLALEATLWSPSRSIFIYNPFLIALFPVLYFFFKNRWSPNSGSYDGSEKRLISIMLATNVGETTFQLFWPAWWGGHSYGPRIFADNIFIYLLIFIIALGSLKKYSLRMKKGFLRFSLFMLALGLAMNIQGIRNLNTLKWNDYPDVDFYREKVIFDWRFPQFLTLTEESVNRKSLIQSREYGIFRDAEVVKNFEIIRNAVLKYIAMNGDLDKLYPLKLEKMGLLPATFGGFPLKHPGRNWTKNNYWIGSLNHTFGIGYYPADLKLATLLKNRFSSEVERIYFPFPEVFKEKKIEEGENPIGRIILQFKMPSQKSP